MTSELMRPTPTAGGVNSQRASLSRQVFRSRIFALVAFDAAVIGLITIKNPDFIRWDNLLVILNNMALPAIAVVATVFLLSAGRFDLSIDGVAALAGIVSGKLMAGYGAGTVAGVAAGLGVGLIVGLVNGGLIERLGLNPLVITLATWWGTAGIALGITQGNTPYGFPQSFQDLGQLESGGILITTFLAIGVSLVGCGIIAGSRFAGHAKATGGDREAARLNGVNVRRVGMTLYVASALAAAAAGILLAARLNSATGTPYDGLALDVIASAVIGGATIGGGRGSIVGGLLGLLLLNMLGNGAIYVGISPYWEKAISGLVLLLAVLRDAIAARRAAGGGWGTTT